MISHPALVARVSDHHFDGVNKRRLPMLTRQDREAIEGLFERLADAERRGGPRDAEAEALIRELMARQPSSPYYLAQTVVVQQEALKEAERRIEALEDQSLQPARRRGPWDRGPSAEDREPQGRGFGGGGFLAGAAQTAMGVAGGMMLGSLIGSIFSPGAAQAAEPAAEDNTAPEDQGAPDSGDAGGFESGGFDDGGFDMGGDF
jgi:hypothetical protein